MKKTKRIWGIILALALVVTVTACRNEEDNRSSSDTSNLESATASSSENENDAYMPPPDENYIQPDSGTPSANLATPTPDQKQTIYLWEEGKMPAARTYSADSGYFDPPDFRPFIESYPAKGEVKGAVLICPGGAFQFRSMTLEGYRVAERLSELGYQCFVVSYRLNPYTQEEGALDLARAVRYVRANAEAYGIDEKDIAVVGFSAGGILCGELLLQNDGNQLPSELDESYTNDTLDSVSADAGAIGHIYSFYGRLSVSNNDIDTLKQGDLPPTFYAYGTRDPFYNQFKQNANACREAGVTVEEHSFDGQPHGFGDGNSNSDWIPLFDTFLSNVFGNN